MSQPLKRLSPSRNSKREFGVRGATMWVEYKAPKHQIRRAHLVFFVMQNRNLEYGGRRCGFNTKHQSTKDLMKVEGLGFGVCDESGLSGLTPTPQQNRPSPPLHEPLHRKAKRDPKAKNALSASPFYGRACRCAIFEAFETSRT